MRNEIERVKHRFKIGIISKNERVTEHNYPVKVHLDKGK
jgi:hypothetical protein